MDIKIFVNIYIIGLLIGSSCEVRILGIFSTPSISHQIVYRTITEELARRGHHLTIMTTDPVDYKEPEFSNITQIDVKEISYKLWTDFFNFVEKRKIYLSQKMFITNYYDLTLKITDRQLSHPEMRKLIADQNGGFDLCIVESNVPSIFAFKDRFNCPMIQINSIGLAPQNAISFGYPVHVFMYMNNFAPYDPYNLNLFQKFDLIYSDIAYKMYYYLYYIPLYTKLTRKYFGPNTRPANVIENESDLILMNYHPVLHGIRPTLPTMVSIGSIHIGPTKPLPKDLQRILDGATNGVIYFNLGTNVKSRQLPESKRIIFLKAFQEMPYTVIWKWEDDNLPGKPSNVHVSKWLPQQSILAHPNVKLFVTQGGKQSIEETIHYGVPIIGISFFGDQFANCFKMEKHGAGLSLPFDKVTTSSFKGAVKEITTNPKYRENIVKLRDLLYDQPQTPLERAIWWIEYVIRHKGAKHLRSPAADASYFHYYMMDIILLLMATLACLFYTGKFIKRMFSKYSIVIRTEMMKKVV